MSRGPQPQLGIDHDALARELLESYRLLTKQGPSESPQEQLRRVCLHLGYHLEHICKRQMRVTRFTAEQFAQVAVELVRVFGGECAPVGSAARPMVLRAAKWTVPEEARDGPHPSSLVPEILAEIAARNFGYGKVAAGRVAGGGFEFRVHLKASRHAQLDDGIEYTPEDLPDAGELHHELLHQLERVSALRGTLLRVQERLNDLAHQAPECLLSANLDGRCIYANEAACRLLEYAPEQLRGLKLAELAAPESRESLEERFGQAATGSVTDLFRVAVVTRSGEQRDVSLRLWPRRREGRVVGVEALGRDVSNQKAYETALRRSEALYRTLVDLSPDAIFMLDADGRITFANPRTRDALGCSEEELIGSYFGKHLAPESRASGQAAFQEAMAPDAGPAGYELNLIAKTGRVYHADISVCQVRENGDVVGLLGIARDITHRREVEQELYQQHRALWALNAIGNAVSRSLDLQETLEDALEKVLQVTDFGGGVIFLLEGDVLRPTATHGVSESTAEQIPEIPVGHGIAGQVVTTGEPLVVHPISTPDARGAQLVRDLGLQTYVAVPLVAQQQVLGVMGLGAGRRLEVSQDLLDLLLSIGSQVGMGIQNARLFEQTQQQARTDFLTGLHNRQHLQELFKQESQRAARYGHSIAVLMLDLDDLKSINDAFGHRVGDEALRAVADALRSALRTCDIAARYGGDEFVVVMPETDAAGAQAVAVRIGQQVAALNRSSRLPVPINVGVGVAAADADFDRLLDAADLDMYADKQRAASRQLAGA